METIVKEINPVFINFSRIAKVLSYSSLYLSLAGGAMVFLSCSLQNLAFSPVAALIMILVTYGVYNLNRKTDEAEDSLNHFERYSFTKKYGPFLYRTAALAYIGALGIGILYGAEIFLITLIPLLSGVLYSVPILPQKTGYSRLKEVPVFKSATVAVAWAVPPAFLPAYLTSTGITLQTLLIALLFSILVFVNTVMFDIRDLEGDRASGVKTIPAILGADKTVLSLSALNAVTGLFIVFLGHALFSPEQIAFICFCIIYAQVYILHFRDQKEDKITSEIFMDGQFIILFGVILFFSII
jgi:4-hydroxybenzoate polyprenyltransferase